MTVRATLARTIERLGRAVEGLTVLLTGGLVLLVTTNVVARYVLEMGLLWAEEVSRLTFVWVVFLGAFMALRRHAHLSLTFVYDRLAPRLQSAVRIVGALLVLGFLGILIWKGAELVQQTVRFGRITPILGISAGWGYLSVPVAALLMFLEVVRGLLVDGFAPHPSGTPRQPEAAEERIPGRLSPGSDLPDQG